ncbi:MAG: TIM barrel protein [Chloroflexi bacterium]|nr:TIM barrel protein [Chloroflexota bacterium]
MKLGLVTYNLARTWDLETIISRCESAGYEAAQLRTEHGHGVEVTLNAAERAEIRDRFRDSDIKEISLGSTCEYHSLDAGEVGRQIELTKRFVDLAVDIGAVGVKVRPNGLQEAAGVPREKTLEQIGLALRQCGQHAEGSPVSIWLEVHGPETSHPPNIRRIMEAADHSHVGVCWNSNPTDVVDGSVREYFELLRPWGQSVHLSDLADPKYPWRELFALLRESGYSGYCLVEYPRESAEPETFMRYYAALWRELCRPDG